MGSQLRATLETRRRKTGASELDLVVPYTTPALTRAALEACDRMSAGLNANIRLVRIQVVPYPMDLDRSPVDMHFLLREMEECKSGIFASCEIRLARDFEEGLLSSLKRHSVVVLSYEKHWWKSANERLAAKIRTAGRKLVLVPGKENNA